MRKHRSAWAMYCLGEMYEGCARGDHGIKMDRRKAFEWYWRAAEHGDPNAMYRLGEAFLSGEEGIVTKSAEEGVRWLKSAAEMGQATAQMALGIVTSMETTQRKT